MSLQRLYRMLTLTFELNTVNAKLMLVITYATCLYVFTSKLKLPAIEVFLLGEGTQN